MTEVPGNREMLLVLFLLGASIIGFNYPDIFSLKTMYVDDNHRYILGLENKIHALIFKRNSLRALVLFPLYKLMSINLVYARLAQTLFFYIPLAFSWYCLLRYYTNMPPWLIFYASAVPCLLPGQTQIPSFIDGSYTVQGLLVFILMLHISYKYLRYDGFSWKYFLAAAALFGASLEMMDHSVFLAPFAVLSFIGVSSWKENKKKIIVLSSIILALALAKSIQIILYPTVSASVPSEPSISLFVDRMLMLGKNTFPFSFYAPGKNVDSKYLWIIFIVLFFISFVKASRSERIILSYAILFVICSSFVFLTISKYYSPRLAHIPGFGINLILIMSIYIITKNVKVFYKYDLSFFLCLLVLLFSGYSRLNNVNMLFSSYNKFHNVFTEKLANYDFPPNSQLVILDGNVTTDGWWIYSSGYIKYALKRKDMSGIIGPQYKNHDPFNQEKRGFSLENKMSGLSFRDPIFIFKFLKYPQYILEQREFLLQYVDDSWTIFKLNKMSGQVQILASGTGVNNFYLFLNDIKIAPENVAFAQGIER